MRDWRAERLATAGGTRAETLRAKTVREVTRPVVESHSTPDQAAQQELPDVQEESPAGLPKAALISISAALSRPSQARKTAEEKRRTRREERIDEGVRAYGIV